MIRVIRSDKPVTLLLLLWSHKCDFGAEPRSCDFGSERVKVGYSGFVVYAVGSLPGLLEMFIVWQRWSNKKAKREL
jgi:hypothetical protein